MEYEIKSDYEQGEKNAKMKVSIQRRNVRKLVSGIVANFKDNTGFSDAVSIRTKKKNPVVKNKEGDKIYFKWDEGELEIDFGLSSPKFTSEAVHYIRTKESPGQELYSREPDETEGRDIGDIEETIGEVSREVPDETPENIYPNDPHEDADKIHSDEDSDQDDGLTDYGDNVSEGAKVRGERTEFTPMYSKTDVNYIRARDKPNGMPDCRDCVHYIEGGGCHMVRGEIEEEGVCEDVYSDIGFFGRVDQQGVGDSFLISLTSYGDEAFKRVWGVSAAEMKEKFAEVVDELKEFTE